MPMAGAAKGIGLACASCLGHEGCKVVVADIDDSGASRCSLECHNYKICLFLRGYMQTVTPISGTNPL